MKAKRKITVPATPKREEPALPPPEPLRWRRRQPINRVPKDKVKRDDADWNF